MVDLEFDAVGDFARGACCRLERHLQVVDLARRALVMNEGVAAAGDLDELETLGLRRRIRRGLGRNAREVAQRTIGFGAYVGDGRHRGVRAGEPALMETPAAAVPELTDLSERPAHTKHPPGLDVANLKIHHVPLASGPIAAHDA